MFAREFTIDIELLFEFIIVSMLYAIGTLVINFINCSVLKNWR